MPKYRIEVDRDECTGDALCVDEAPDVFELDDEGVAVVVNPDGNPDEIYAAAEACPTDAIVLYDAETGEKIWPRD